MYLCTINLSRSSPGPPSLRLAATSDQHLPDCQQPDTQRQAYISLRNTKTSHSPRSTRNLAHVVREPEISALCWDPPPILEMINTLFLVIFFEFFLDFLSFFFFQIYLICAPLGIGAIFEPLFHLLRRRHGSDQIGFLSKFIDFNFHSRTRGSPPQRAQMPL